MVCSSGQIVVLHIMFLTALQYGKQDMYSISLIVIDKRYVDNLKCEVRVYWLVYNSSSELL